MANFQIADVLAKQTRTEMTTAITARCEQPALCEWCINDEMCRISNTRTTTAQPLPIMTSHGRRVTCNWCGSVLQLATSFDRASIAYAWRTCMTRMHDGGVTLKPTTALKNRLRINNKFMELAVARASLITESDKDCHKSPSIDTILPISHAHCTVRGCVRADSKWRRLQRHWAVKPQGKNLETCGNCCSR